MSSLIMSISGIRGIVGDSLSPSVSLQVGMAFGHFCGKGPVVVGGDTRTSFKMIQSAALSGLLAVGIDVIDIGQVTTPTLQQAIGFHKATGGIMITASHNPIEWNGLKLMNAQGSFLSNAEYQRFSDIYSNPALSLSDWRGMGSVASDLKAIDRHVDLIFSKLDITSIQKSGLRVLCDANHGAGAVANPRLLDRLGVSYTMLHAEPHGQFAHNPEPLEKNLEALISGMKSGNYDIGFAQDADADRLVIIDEKGRFIGEDYSLGYCVDYILKTHPQKNQQVVVNLSTSNVIRDIATRHGATLHQTKIGEMNVTEGLKRHQALVGGEGNGGVIYPQIGWGRDSLVGMVIALKHRAESEQSVSETVSSYPAYTMIKHQFTLSNRDDLAPLLVRLSDAYKAYPQDHQDGVKVMFEDGWVHVRPSNTEPIARIYIEKPTREAGEALLHDIQKLQG